MIYDVIIIGAGQAGISMSQKLKNQGINHLMIDSHSYIGEQWRSRYDSLILFTPRSYSSLPGLMMEGAPEGYPTKDEMATYLQQYVQYFELPVFLKVKVEKLKKKEDIFVMQTSKGELAAKKVVVATGAFQNPNAGASFTPSPTIATLPYLARNCLMKFNLSSGISSACTLDTPT